MEYSLASVRALEEAYGLPLYVFSADEFAENFRRFVGTMQASYPNYRLAYSFKTNYTPAICALVKKLGGYAEVVSDMEYRLAKDLGYENAKIIYNGPCKGALADDHILQGGILNVDSLEELRRVCALADSNAEKKLSIGLRINIDVGQPFISRFGLDASSGEVEAAAALIKSTPNLTLSGIHCHVSQARALHSWAKRMETMLSIADSLFETAPQYIDLGSGMYGEMAESFYHQFSDVPDYAAYASVTAKVMAAHYPDCSPILFTEPGTTVVNRYVDVLAQVAAVKTIRGKTFVTVNASKHILGEVCTLKKLPLTVVPVAENREKVEDAAIVGYTCLEHDVLYPGFTGEIGVGDYLIFGNVGGYSNVLKPPFIHPNCAMVMVQGDTVRIIKRAETQTDIFGTYEMGLE